MYRLVGLLAVFVTAGIAYVLFSNTSGAKDTMAAAAAQAICGALKPGMTIKQASALATDKNGWLHEFSANDARAGASGWHSKCGCNIALKDGGIATVSRSFCIN